MQHRFLFWEHEEIASDRQVAHVRAHAVMPALSRGAAGKTVSIRQECGRLSCGVSSRKQGIGAHVEMRLVSLRLILIYSVGGPTMYAGERRVSGVDIEIPVWQKVKLCLTLAGPSQG